MKKIYTVLGSLAFATSISFCQTTSQLFNYTGAMQTFVVPPCVNSITFDVIGAQGGGDITINAPGGKGGRVQGTLAVTPGQTLNIFIGGQGDSLGPAGYNGGGLGANGGDDSPGGGGGGASDIRIGGITFLDRVVVAGGGGGSTENGGIGIGGDGGGLTGASATCGGNPWACTNLTVATGGTQSTGGLGGTSTSCAWNGADGSFGLGGDAYPTYRCAGGGGGWYGGGGAHNGCAGGGGSSYTDPVLVTGAVHTQGYQLGNGQIILTYTAGSVAGTAGSTATSGNLCAFDSINFFTTGSVGTVDWYLYDTINMVWNMFGSGNPYNPGPPDNTNVGAYLFMAIVTNGSCPADTSNTFTVNVRQTPVVTLGNDSTQCGGSITLDAGNPGNTYSWNSSQTTQLITVNASGSYIATVTSSFGCVGADTIMLTFNTPPTVTGFASSMNPCLNDALVTLTGSPGSGTWSGTAVTGSTFNPLTAGVGPHILTYSFTDVNGCSNIATITVNVNACAGIAEHNSGNGIDIYPNPNNGTFTISSNVDLGNTTIEVMDMQGKLVYSSLENSVKVGFEKQIDISTEESGIYLVRIISNGEEQILKINVLR